jgi:hypothetical protein
LQTARVPVDRAKGRRQKANAGIVRGLLSAPHGEADRSLYPEHVDDEGSPPRQGDGIFSRVPFAFTLLDLVDVAAQVGMIGPGGNVGTDAFCPVAQA